MISTLFIPTFTSLKTVLIWDWCVKVIVVSIQHSPEMHFECQHWTASLKPFSSHHWWYLQAESPSSLHYVSHMLSLLMCCLFVVLIWNSSLAWIPAHCFTVSALAAHRQWLCRKQMCLWLILSDALVNIWGSCQLNVNKASFNVINFLM